jgi:hypothetical protein
MHIESIFSPAQLPTPAVLRKLNALNSVFAGSQSYGRAIELDNSRVFALIESGNIQLMLFFDNLSS